MTNEGRSEECLIGKGAPPLGGLKHYVYNHWGALLGNSSNRPWGSRWSRISLFQTLPQNTEGKSNSKLERSFQALPGEAEDGAKPALVD